VTNTVVATNMVWPRASRMSRETEKIDQKFRYVFAELENNNYGMQKKDM
jgi:hypothetical protein